MFPPQPRGLQHFRSSYLRFPTHSMRLKILCSSQRNSLRYSSKTAGHEVHWGQKNQSQWRWLDPVSSKRKEGQQRLQKLFLYHQRHILQKRELKKKKRNYIEKHDLFLRRFCKICMRSCGGINKGINFPRLLIQGCNSAIKKNNNNKKKKQKTNQTHTHTHTNPNKKPPQNQTQWKNKTM